MKIISLLISLLIFTSLGLQVFAEEIELNLDDSQPPIEQQQSPAPIILAPKWEEFCEPGYENVNASDKADILNILSFVKSERAKRTYWAERRESFNKYLNYCKAKVDDNERGECYTELRQIENNKNEVYNSQRKQGLYQSDMIIKDSSK
ncbi:hypothetical protein IAC76_08205 [Spirochaetes bacterium]|uniref:Uncharacterized protein n=1 Tax=Candidatus Scatousia excrementipullorum TaxID=2840936 RepID=A0A9D9DRA0_9BACT|nr:hypothetical protein [Candidatus Scatousia excrementipullorum]